MLLGILPNFVHEPPSMNTFLRPFVDELTEFWNQGVRLYTTESPKYKLLFKIALMCVACTIPAARNAVASRVMMLILDVHLVQHFFLVALILRTVVDFKENHGLHNHSKTT